MYACMYVYMYVCMHANMYVSVYVCMYVCMYVCVCMYVFMYVRMYASSTNNIDKFYNIKQSIGLYVTSVTYNPRHILELDRYIGNTHHRGRLWDNRNHRNHRQMMTIGDQSVPMFHDDVTH